MAQFYFDPNDWDVGDGVLTAGFPFEITRRAGGVDPTVEIRNDGTSNYLFVEANQGNRNLVGYIPAGTPLNAELYVEQTSSTSVNALRFAVRGYTSDGTVDGEAFWYQVRNLGIDKITNSSLSNIASFSSVDRFTRFFISGTSPASIKARTWESNPEPSTWSVEIDNSEPTLQQSGRVGLAPLDGSLRIYAFGVGTNGDPAPTSEPTGGTDDLTADDISSSSQVSSPAITQTHALTANDVSSLSSVTAPVIGQTHALTSTDVQSISEVSSPALATQANTDNLSANDISSTSTVSSPALGQVHNLAANDATSNTETSTPTLQQTHALTSVDVSSLSTVSSPSLTEVVGQDNLSANDIQAASEVSSPTIGQVHNLTANDTESATETSQPAIGQVHGLTADNVASLSAVTTPTLQDISGALATPIKNTRATVSQVQYGATVSQTTYKAAIIQTVYKAEAG